MSSGSSLAEVAHRLRSSISRLPKHWVVPPDVCDAQYPVLRRSYGPDIAAICTPARLAPGRRAAPRASGQRARGYRKVSSSSDPHSKHTDEVISWTSITLRTLTNSRIRNNKCMWRLARPRPPSDSVHSPDGGQDTRAARRHLHVTRTSTAHACSLRCKRFRSTHWRWVRPREWTTRHFGKSAQQGTRRVRAC